tara:strand:- start:675 stop:884 length:210 start_codon:yes stop_codon:yes gene_type:complete
MKKKYRVLETVSGVDGTLYKEEIVTFQNEEADGNWRVKDNMGRIWFVSPNICIMEPPATAAQLSRSKNE